LKYALKNYNIIVTFATKVKNLINFLVFVDDEWLDGWMDGWFIMLFQSKVDSITWAT
jgi:hypothetical protein